MNPSLLLRSILTCFAVPMTLGFVSPKVRSKVNVHSYVIPKANLTSEQESLAVSTFQDKFGARRRDNPIDESRLVSSLRTLADVVGDESALNMALTDPKVLEFRSANFQAVFDAYCANLGEDEALGMVLRNPALMGVPPSGYGGADKAGKDAVVVSYIIAATRPLGGLWLSLLFLVLATPAIEAVTGIDFRASFLPEIFRDLKFID